MVKTLRITSIIITIAAVILLILPAVFGVRPDPQIEQFLKEPTALDKFIAARGQHSAKNDNQVSPLVNQASELARYLNPPPPTPPPTPVTPVTANAPEPISPVTAKFDLIGTSFYATRPELSLALIDEPGKGLHWVRQGSNIGHLTIEKVGDGSITAKDSQRTFEMPVKEQKELWKKLLKNHDTNNVETAPATTGAGASAPQPSTSTKVSSPATPVRPGSMRQRLEESRRARSGAPGVQPQPAPPDIKQAGPPTAVVPAPLPDATPAPPPAPVVETSPREKEIEAKIQKLTDEMGSSQITNNDSAKMDELVKLIEELGAIRASEQSAKPQP